ncbi:MAG: Tim44-like domain-containing protein [Pseudomonadota bacterium]
MKNTLMLLVALLGLSLVAVDADAARLGGGSSKQRQITPTPNAPAAAPSATPAAPAPQPSGMSKWLGPLAGLALGAGLASLFMGNGMAGAFGGIMMMLLIAAAAMFAWRMLRRKPQSEPLQYAGAGAQGAPARPPNISNMFGGGATTPAATVNRFPPGFDAEQFARHAKLNFTQLQAANDRRDLSTMRDFMTPELYSEIAAQVAAAGNAPQKTDVVTLDAEVLEVVTEGVAYIASVRFSGTIRESADALPEPFSEVWHLEKKINGNTGWLISGIQQD